MLQQQPWLDHQQFSNELSQLCAGGKTGTLFCSTNDAKSVTVGIQQGKIISLSYKALRGHAALSELSNLTRCRGNFRDNIILHQDPDLPGTADLLQRLNRAKPPASQNQASIKSAPVTTTVNSISISKFDIPKLKNLVTEVSTELFGPVGAILCAEAFATSTPRDRDELRELLRGIVNATGETTLLAPFISTVMSNESLK